MEASYRVARTAGIGIAQMLNDSLLIIYKKKLGLTLRLNYFCKEFFSAKEFDFNIA